VLNKALVVAEKVSFERGPSNGVLGDADRRDPAKIARLVKARAVSDAALAALDEAVASAPPTEQTRRAAIVLRSAKTQLEAGRASVDAVAGMPLAHRTPVRVMGAVHAMYDIVPIAMTAAELLSRDAQDVYPQLADTLVSARLAAELREYAGRLGSQFTAALTTQKPLARSDAEGAWEMRGRVYELRDLIAVRVFAPVTDPRILAANETMNLRYFGDDLAFVASAERASNEHRPYGIDTAQFATRYVPAMGTIVALRDVLVTSAVERAQEQHTRAVRYLVGICIFGAIAFAIVCSLLIIMRRRVIRPLVTTTRVITGIARGELDTVVPVGTRKDEIAAVLGAVETLRQTSIQKATLEGERERLIDELRISSTTDYLTGLMNRRAFIEAAQSQLASAHRHGSPLSLIMFDIDHFKDVNDKYGHDVGDAVLIALAALARDEFRVEDIVCRYGGEEFAVLAPHSDREDAASLTERVRMAIEAMRVPLAGGGLVSVTASFGIVVAPAETNVGLNALVHAADEALYRAKADGRNRVAVSAGVSPLPSN
jgi:diguanylate cyclase (GGDEF)-like protein